jgi:hypothetical protein
MLAWRRTKAFSGDGQADCGKTDHNGVDEAGLLLLVMNQ